MLRRLKGYLHQRDLQMRDVQRRLSRIEYGLGIQAEDYRVDVATPRQRALSFLPHPVLAPGAFPWMKGVVYDARPIDFGGKELAYFCAQNTYSPSLDTVLGRATWDGQRYAPESAPVIYPTDEAYGIDIPSFFTADGRVGCVYFDNYGPERSRDCRARDLYLCWSRDGMQFEKTRIARPLADYPHANPSLPWIEPAGGELRFWIRAKVGVQSYISRASFDPQRGTLRDWRHLALAINPINIGIVTVEDLSFVFCGRTVAGGFYVACVGAANLALRKLIMLCGDDSHDEWGWDFRKICPSPLVRSGELIILYLSDFKIGRATMPVARLLEAAHAGGA
jgi:hypothetical protein